jgi:hypothetical protein
MIDVALLTEGGFIFCDIPADVLIRLRERVLQEGGDIVLKVTVCKGDGTQERAVWMRPNMILVKLGEH